MPEPPKRSRWLREGDPCPDCGERLVAASLSGAYLKCCNDHTHVERVKCQKPGCRKVATSRVAQLGSRPRRYSLCDDHDEWPFRLGS